MKIHRIRTTAVACWMIRMLCLLGSTHPFFARADVRLPALFSDHMVLQREMSAPVWGWAEAGESITVTIAGQSKSTKTDADGKWSIKLDKLETGGPLTMIVKGKNSLLSHMCFCMDGSIVHCHKKPHTS